MGKRGPEGPRFSYKNNFGPPNLVRRSIHLPLRVWNRFLSRRLRVSCWSSSLLACRSSVIIISSILTCNIYNITTLCYIAKIFVSLRTPESKPDCGNVTLYRTKTANSLRILFDELVFPAVTVFAPPCRILWNIGPATLVAGSGVFVVMKLIFSGRAYS